MRKIGEYLAYAVVLGSGLAIWIVIPRITGDPEAWSSSLYYKVAIPLITIECTVLGFIIQQKWWQWAVLATSSQAVFMIVKWPTSNLLPPSLMFLALLSAPYLIGGFLGNRLKNKFNHKSQSKT